MLYYIDMKRTKFIFIFFTAISLTQSAVYAQPEITQEKIPLTASPALRKQIEKLYSQNPLERKRAAAKIGELSKEAQDAIPFLIELLGDSSYCPEPGVIYEHTPLVYETVNWALIQIGTPSVKPLINALTSSVSLIRTNAAYCLGRIKDRRAVEPLIKLLNDGDSWVRWQAIRALAELKDRRATEPLLKLLNDEQLRTEIIHVLGQIGDASAIDTLSFYLKDKNAEVRIAVISALGNIGHKSAVPFLINALSDKDSGVKCQAISSLGKIGDASAIDALVSVINSGQKEPTYRSIDALRQIGNKKAAEILIALLDDKDANIRKNASWALHGIRGAGVSFGEDSARWKAWLNENQGKLKK